LTTCLKFKKIRRTFLQKEYFGINQVHYNFVGKWTSKWRGQLLTLSGTSRVKFTRPTYGKIKSFSRCCKRNYHFF
jgi:hypothetical protein